AHGCDAAPPPPAPGPTRCASDHRAPSHRARVEERPPTTERLGATLPSSAVVGVGGPKAPPSAGLSSAPRERARRRCWPRGGSRPRSLPRARGPCHATTLG